MALHHDQMLKCQNDVALHNDTTWLKSLLIPFLKCLRRDESLRRRDARQS